MTKLFKLFGTRILSVGAGKACTNGGIVGEELEIDQKPYE